MGSAPPPPGPAQGQPPGPPSRSCAEQVGRARVRGLGRSPWRPWRGEDTAEPGGAGRSGGGLSGAALRRRPRGPVVPSRRARELLVAGLGLAWLGGRGRVPWPLGQRDERGRGQHSGRAVPAVRLRVGGAGAEGAAGSADFGAGEARPAGSAPSSTRGAAGSGALPVPALLGQLPVGRLGALGLPAGRARCHAGTAGGGREPSGEERGVWMATAVSPNPGRGCLQGAVGTDCGIHCSIISPCLHCQEWLSL